MLDFPGDVQQVSGCLLVLPVMDVWNCECPESRRRSQSWEGLSQRLGKLQQKGAISFHTMDWTEDGLPSEMPAQVCVAVGRSMRLCARLCLSVSPSAWCMGTMPCCFAMPSLLAPRQPLSQPCSPTHPSSSAIPSFSSYSTLTHLFAYESILFSITLFFLFNLFMGFIEVLKCKELVLMRPLCYCSLQISGSL